MKDILRKCGLKVTKGRVEVLKLLKKRDRPMTAEEVYSIIPRDICSSLSTVYRILNQLSEKGILTKSLKQNGITYYEYSTDVDKHFIVCSNCGKIERVDYCPMDEAQKIIKDQTGYDINGHLVEFTGICPDCKKKKSKED